MRLIDADALRACFPMPNDMTDPQQALYHVTGIWAEIDAAPTIEDLSGFCDRLWRGAYERGKEEGKAEIVRCHKCVHWQRDTVRQNSNDAGWWNEAICEQHSRYGNETYEAWTMADWYCADAEGRDDGPTEV